MSTLVIHDLSPADLAAVKAAVKASPLRGGLAVREVLRAGLESLKPVVKVKAKAKPKTRKLPKAKAPDA